MSARWDDRALIDRSAKDPEYHVLTDQYYVLEDP